MMDRAVALGINFEADAWAELDVSVSDLHGKMDFCLELEINFEVDAS